MCCRFLSDQNLSFYQTKCFSIISLTLLFFHLIFLSSNQLLLVLCGLDSIFAFDFVTTSFDLQPNNLFLNVWIDLLRKTLHAFYFLGKLSLVRSLTTIFKTLRSEYFPELAFFCRRDTCPLYPAILSNTNSKNASSMCCT